MLLVCELHLLGGRRPLLGTLAGAATCESPLHVVAVLPAVAWQRVSQITGV